MTAERWAEIDRVFQEASALPQAERLGFLAHRCAHDTELHREVCSLLDCAEGAETFVAACVDETLQPSWNVLLPGGHVGEYRLERLLGSGGMGSVYLAVRDDGEFDQQVAIKFSHSITASDWTAERFRYERRILAQLEHPHIARLLGGGATLHGAPYLVMEYVDGEPLTQWCAVRQTPTRERLEVFLDVCDAVAHAHRHLVVHRDLKPGNILVTADGAAKLLDFGISKLLDPARGDENASTVRLLTPAYASPEQLQSRPLTTATDVYSLGAILYELLSGRTPFAGATPLELERAICETDPPPPSAVPGSQCPRGDLDNIVWKALQKDPARRYSSVEQLATDLRLYLAGRPITARPASIAYFAARFLQRHRTAALVTAVLALVAVTLAVKLGYDAQRSLMFYRELRTLVRGFMAEVPPRVEGLPAAQVRRQLARLFDERMQGLLSKHGSDVASTREMALGYEVLGRQFGIEHEQAEESREEGLFYFRRAIAALEVHRRSGRIDRHGLAILGRCRCGVARLLARNPDMASQAEAASEFRACLDIQRSGFTWGGPWPGASYVREYVLAHAFAGEFELASWRFTTARTLFTEMASLARTQQSRDARAKLWESVALAGVSRATGARLSPAACVTFDLGSSRPHVDSQVLAARLAQQCAAEGLVPPAASARVAAALQRDYPAHPLVVEFVNSAQVLKPVR